MAVRHLAPGVAIEDSALTWTQERGGGPGGQHVNTTASNVQLRLTLTAITGLSVRAEDRFLELASHLVTDDGELVITCGETRSAGRNKDLLWERLCELVRDAQAVPPPRRKTKPSRASVHRRLDGKAHQGEKKRLRRDGE